jgi:hypothetical protein
MQKEWDLAGPINYSSSTPTRNRLVPQTKTATPLSTLMDRLWTESGLDEVMVLYSSQASNHVERLYNRVEAKAFDLFKEGNL